MKIPSTGFILVTFISLSQLPFKYEVKAASEQVQPTDHNTMSNNTICQEGFMSVYVSKVQFAGLPFTIYVKDERGRYYQAAAIAKQCHYFLGESDTLIILMVSSSGCFVRRQKHITSLTVVIVAPADNGRVEIVKTMHLICERRIKEENKKYYISDAGQLFCNKDGFNITILQNATDPPLNLDAVWIPSSQSHNCKPKTSPDAVTFSFPFTDCGTQSVIADGKIIYWVNIEGKQHQQNGSVFRDRLLHLTVQCSFSLAQRSQPGIKVKKEKYPSALKSEGILRAEMRFAKDSSYRSFYSSHKRPAVTELDQPVYVEVFILKHEDKDLVLLLEDCWATPTQDPHHPQRWNLLVKGCPFSGDSHRTAVIPVGSRKEVMYPSHHKRFMVKMFSFVKPQTSDNLVYFHCDIEICKGPDCFQSCSKEAVY